MSLGFLQKFIAVRFSLWTNRWFIEDIYSLIYLCLLQQHWEFFTGVLTHQQLNAGSSTLSQFREGPGLLLTRSASFKLHPSIYIFK